MKTREKVIKLRNKGKTYQEIQDMLGIASPSTINYHLRGTFDFPPRKTVLEMDIGDAVGFSGNGKHWTIKRDE